MRDEGEGRGTYGLTSIRLSSAPAWSGRMMSHSCLFVLDAMVKRVDVKVRRQLATEVELRMEEEILVAGLRRNMKSACEAASAADAAVLAR